MGGVDNMTNKAMSHQSQELESILLRDLANSHFGGMSHHSVSFPGIVLMVKLFGKDIL